jgi:hypothetical protein
VKDYKRSGRMGNGTLILHYFPGWFEENHKKISQHNWYAAQESNLEPSKYKAAVSINAS